MKTTNDQPMTIIKITKRMILKMESKRYFKNTESVVTTNDQVHDVTLVQYISGIY
jgi:hypothetical protein